MEIRLVDLFCGCGGMSLGFQNAGFDIVAAYDNWDPAIQVYRDNFHHPIHAVDLSDESIIEKLIKIKPNIIVGGPPCQDFSIAGKRDFEGKKANLTMSYANIIATVKPDWFVMENVYNIEKSNIYHNALDIMKSSGYGLTKLILNASQLGVPQMRKRCFVIGKLGEKDDFMKEEILSGLTKEKMTVKQYLGDLIDTDYYYMHPRSYNRRAVFSVNEPSSTIRGVNRPMPPNYAFHKADKSTDASQIRSLTTKERSYLQTFPTDYVFNGRKSNLEQMIGNAVPVKMAEYVAKTIMAIMNENTK